MEKLSYIPFERFSVSLLKEKISEGYHYFIIQRFPWKGFTTNTSFIAFPYLENYAAASHLSDLKEKEGKLFSIPEGSEKLAEIITNPDLNVFINEFKDADWKSRTLKAYKNSIQAYLRANTPFTPKDPIDIDIRFNTGRLEADIYSGDRHVVVPAHQLFN